MLIFEYMDKPVCIVCGASVKWKTAKTCSRECANVVKKQKTHEARICLNCGQSFEVRRKMPNKLCSDKCRKEWSSKEENKQLRIEKSRISYKEKTGYNSIFENPLKKSEISEKARLGIEAIGKKEFVRRSKNTKQKRHGDENYNNHRQAKETKKEKYGDENYNNRIAAEGTMKGRYGVSHVMKLEHFQKKAQDTLEERIGHRHPYQSPDIMKAIRERIEEKYGVSNVSQLQETKTKVRDAYFKNFSETVIQYQLDHSSIALLDEYKGIQKQENRNSYATYRFKCSDCDSEFTGTFSNHVIPTCRTCFPTHRDNLLHQEMRSFLKDLGVAFEDNVRHVISPFELDFYIKDFNLAIEIDGNYYHSELGGGKSRDYHLQKTILAQKQGIKLIHVFEDEWRFKKEIVKSMITNMLGFTPSKLYARKTEIVNIDKQIAKEFLNKNHIQGDCRFDIAIGLMFENELISVLAISQKKTWEIVRFCSKIDFGIIGGFSKLIKHLQKKYPNQSFITYADCRYSGIDHAKTVYATCGFTFKHRVKPRYWYFRKGNYNRRYHRFAFNKKRLIKMQFDFYEDWMTEWDLAMSIGMDRIWDCGNLVYELH